MRKSFYSWFCSLCCLPFAGCSDFLEESSQDEVRPSTVEDLEQLLLGEGYLRTNDVVNYLELLTDNVENHYTWNDREQSVLAQGSPVFMWEFDMFERMEEEGYACNTWGDLYSKIKGCNVVLDMLPQVTGDEENKLNQRGQALALRASYYFMLVNMYALPYNAEGIDRETALGVPLILESTVKDDFPPRASLARVYEQIETDLLEAAELLDQYGQGNINLKVTPLFPHMLLSRMYLYMEDWENAAAQASIVIEKNPQLRRLSDYYRLVEDPWGLFPPTMEYDSEGAAVYGNDSPELIYGYGSAGSGLSHFYPTPDWITYPGSEPVFAVSDELINSHDANDLRPHYYYYEYLTSWLGTTDYLYGTKAGGTSNESYSSAKGMRVAEAYLNRAEANIRLFIETGNDELRVDALEDLNFLREHRYDSPYTDIDIADGEELLALCLDERRKEFSFEDHRWFDLRRLGMPELRHEISFSEGVVQEVILPQGSNRYVLPIPTKVLERNPSLVQNPRD